MEAKSIEQIISEDYRIKGYFKKKIFVKGELRVVEYYENYNEETNEYENLKVKEERQYIRNQLGLVEKRIMKIKFYENNEVFYEKEFVKFYTPIEQFEEDKERSLNIVNEAKVYVLTTLGVENGKDLLNELINEVNLFLEGDGNPLRQKISNLDKFYLTSEIRNKLISIFTI